jgi:hypothetical protein
VATVSQAVHGSRRNVQIGIGSAESEDQNASIQDVVQIFDTSNVYGKDEGGSGSASRLLIGRKEFCVVIRNKHAEEEDAQDVEEENSVKGKLNGARNCLAGILGLANCHTNEFGSEIGKDGVDERRPESIKLPGGAFSDVGSKCPWAFPVFETSGRARTCANSEQESEENDTDL